MDLKTATEKLDREWEQTNDHFFWDLRMGVFNKTGFMRIKDILSSVEIPESETFDKRFIEVIWFIPTFMRWQQEAIEMNAQDAEELAIAISFVEQRLTSILGLP